MRWRHWKTPSARAVYAGNDSLYFRKVSLLIPRNSKFDGQICCKNRCQPAPDAALKRIFSMRKTTYESGVGMGKTPSAHAVYAGNDSLYFRKVSLFVPRNSKYDGHICRKNPLSACAQRRPQAQIIHAENDGRMRWRHRKKRRPRMLFTPETTACTSGKCPSLFRETVNLMAKFAVKTAVSPTNSLRFAVPKPPFSASFP